MANPQTSTKPMMQHKNVAGGMLALFSKNPPVGVYKDGYCRSGDDDKDNHSIAVTITPHFSKSEYATPDIEKLKEGDRTCLAAQHFADAMRAAEEGKFDKAAVPKVHLHASHDKALEVVSYKDLKKYAAEPEAFTQQGRQEAHHVPDSNRGLARQSQSIGGDQPTLAPGAGKNQGKAGEVTGTSGQRG
ncbi:Hypothetical predicted protein [Lecanosticta acicola]|uniref:Uncharacterized protein n=1 Tax=Lecanosticta acicola TaxID=111012 RepID=A0AAI9EF54_9PEZI|nr:Hypothetical predicted protein [Lecanosticta acicola]